MEKFQTFRVTGTKDTIQKILADLLSRSANGWQRSTERERSINAVKDLYCFEGDSRGTRADATLWISTKEDGTLLYDTTIVPISARRLTTEECNTVLKSFVTDMLEPVVSGFRVDIDISGDVFHMRDYITEPTDRKLKSFSAMANKSTGASHPLDRQRWLDFILACHSENAELHAGDLEDWLRQDEWPTDMASDLAIQYELGRDLLRARDKAFGA